MSDLFADDAFEPTLAAAHARIAAARPADYARTRNHVDGAVTRLSPYLTHGFITLPEALAGVRARHRVADDHRLVFEFAWREYFHHVWRHEGERIFASLHAGPMPDAAYARELPADIRRGATGVPVVDRALRTLYATGWLHNHARLWLASYVVHLRKVHWRAGADWLYGHLLDGDLASNHLSWQWVAGTGSAKPYLFNADNVARHAPASWHSAGTPVDATYAALERIARSTQCVPVDGGDGIDEPPLLHAPPADVALRQGCDAGRELDGAWLAHAWALGAPPPGRPVVPVFEAAFHRRWPWSARRWRFVAARMAALGDAPAWLDAAPPTSALTRDDGHAALAPATRQPGARLFPDPGSRCASFSVFWRRVNAG